MSFSDLTRSYSTFPSQSQTATPLRLSQPPAAALTSAREGPSNIPGSSIAAGLTHATALASSSSSSQSSSSSHSPGINSNLALGLGLGLGLSALVAVLVAVFILKSRKSQKADFESRAQVIRDTVESAKARPSLN